MGNVFNLFFFLESNDQTDDGLFYRWELHSLMNVEWKKKKDITDDDTDNQDKEEWLLFFFSHMT